MAKSLETDATQKTGSGASPEKSRLLALDDGPDISTPLDMTDSDVGCKPEDNQFKYI